MVSIDEDCTTSSKTIQEEEDQEESEPLKKAR